MMGMAVATAPPVVPVSSIFCFVSRSATRRALRAAKWPSSTWPISWASAACSSSRGSVASAPSVTSKLNLQFGCGATPRLMALTGSMPSPTAQPSRGERQIPATLSSGPSAWATATLSPSVGALGAARGCVVAQAAWRLHSVNIIAMLRNIQRAALKALTQSDAMRYHP